MRIKIVDKEVIIGNIVKIVAGLFIYTIMCLIILFGFFVDISPSLKEDIFNKTSSRRIAIIGVSQYMGETELGKRLQIASGNIGWQSYFFNYPIILNAIPYFNFPITIANYILYKIFNPEYSLSLTHISNKDPFGTKYLFINVPPKFLMEEETGKFKAKYEHLAGFDGYIDINMSSERPQNHQIIANALTAINKKSNRFTTFVVPVHKIPYQECDPKKLIIFGGNSGTLKNSKRYQELIQMLGKSGYTEFYGPSSAWKSVGDAYKGYLKGDGVSLLRVLKKGCIGLAIHSEKHLDAGIPTTRIMEIAAASAVAISDENQYIKKHFKDQVLFFDQNQDATTMFKQIDDHVKWVLSHPKEAKDLAKAAHGTYYDNYTAEQFLINLEKFHKNNH